ncbi:MAG: tRNA (adenosine(37)-N6)-threonylcarbamoyltransferase complex dimerization subunit type 1 TsaB [Ginsengibacter sp.]
MTYIVNIHTSTDTAIVTLSAGAEILGTSCNHETKQHAAFLHTAIYELLESQGVDIKALKAIGVSSGPGSYTGIRVGLATAKGLCYALKIPLISYSSLEAMAVTATNIVKDPNGLYCPVIDARRMEVYTAMYKFDMEEVAAPSSVILEENSFAEILFCGKVYFIGSGIEKFQQLTKNKNAVFLNGEISSESLAAIAWGKFKKHEFENISHAQPIYIKEFHTIIQKQVP